MSHMPIPETHYVHLKLHRGEVLTIGYDHHCLKKFYEAPDLNKLDALNVLEMRIATACCSRKDRFCKKTAHGIILDKFAAGDVVVGYQQRVGGVWERSFDTLLRTFNIPDNTKKFLPESWRRHYPNFKVGFGTKVEVKETQCITYYSSPVNRPVGPMSHDEAAALVDRYRRLTNGEIVP
jgi:hypothetical protein